VAKIVIDKIHPNSWAWATCVCVCGMPERANKGTGCVCGPRDGVGLPPEDTAMNAWEEGVKMLIMAQNG